MKKLLKFWISPLAFTIAFLVLTCTCDKNDNTEPVCMCRNWTIQGDYTDWIVAPNSECYASCIPCNSIITTNIRYNSYGEQEQYDQYKWDNCTKIKNSPPDAPNLISPTDGSIIAVTDTIRWSCSDPDENFITYDIYFGTDNSASPANNYSMFPYLIVNELEKSSTYYCRIVAKDCYDATTSSSIWSFNVLYDIPTVATTNVNSITSNSAIADCEVTSDGDLAITARGICWSTVQTPTIADNKTIDGTGIGNYSSSLTGLTSNTTYYVRAYATNNVGTGYGSTISFKTYTGTVTDYEGNVYNTVIIGTQEWTVENLKTTKYTDGTEIINLIDLTDWQYSTTPGYCWYNNDAVVYKNTYGALYNWYAVNTDKLCPSGFHVPNTEEWQLLDQYFEMVSGGTLKESGTIHWASPNTGATNESGFTALPGGMRCYDDRGFEELGEIGYWWSSTGNYNNTRGDFCHLDYDNKYLHSAQYPASYGFSVRCVKDE